jgi:16S rRNA processing protein RimM
VVDGVPELLESGTTVAVEGHERVIVRRAGFDARPIVRLDGCDDRDGAQALSGAELLVERERAPELEQDEWWAHDLEGCAVRDGDVEIGVVTRLLDLPCVDALDVDPCGRMRSAVPMIKAEARAAIERRSIEIDLRS